MRCLKCRGPC